MAIVGFSFTKILAEKKSPAKGKVGINNNVSLLGVTDANLSMAETKKGINIRFLFQSKYEPEIGKIGLEGNVVLLEDTKVAEEIINNWEKSKSLPKALMPGLLNHILERSNVQALLLSRDLNLPAPIPLPKVNVQQGAPKEEKKEEKKQSKKKKK